MIKFKNLPDEDKPRERLIKYGIEALTNEELLAIILKTGTRKYSVKELACNLLTEVGSIKNFKHISLEKLKETEGIGLVKALEVKASLELGRRVYEEVSLDEVISCTSPENIIRHFNSWFNDKKQEEFYVIYLNNKKKYLDKKLLYRGSINSSIVHPREIFKEAYLLSASYFICLHNHPSGDATPSKEDIDVTKKLKELGNIHGINLVDHIIIGNNNYYSFYEDEMLGNG